MTPPAEKYRRLPGRRRALASNSSLWMGSDHLLLVKSAWFREEYKRFYLRDIQAIVMARCPRFYISTPLVLFALCWLVFGIILAFGPSFPVLLWIAGSLLMVVAWLWISLRSSCRCRIHTAVSRDDLPSLYRTWTAHKFLHQVGPRIREVQGLLDPDWAEAERASDAAALAASAPPADVKPRAAASAHSLVSDLFVLSLFVGPLVGLATTHAVNPLWFRVNSGLNVLELVGSIAVLVEYYRGRVARGMQRLAVAALVLIGVMFYLQTLSYSFTTAVKGLTPNGPAMTMALPLAVLHQATDGVGLLLGFLGAAMILRSAPRSRPAIIKD